MKILSIIDAMILIIAKEPVVVVFWNSHKLKSQYWSSFFNISQAIHCPHTYLSRRRHRFRLSGIVHCCTLIFCAAHSLSITTKLRINSKTYEKQVIPCTLYPIALLRPTTSTPIKPSSKTKIIETNTQIELRYYLVP